MTSIYLANVLAVLVAAWAVWERRLAFRSRWDAPITWGIGLFGVGAALDSPWPDMAAASYPWTGKYFLLNTLGQICYLMGAAMGTKTIFLRLLSDDAIGPFMRRRIYPGIAAVATVMLTCLVASPVSSAMSAAHLYLMKPDGWLTVYWVDFLGGMMAMGVVSIYGLVSLRADPRSVMLNLLIASEVLGLFAIAAIGFGVLTDNDEIVRVLVWPCAYAGIIGGAMAAVYAWRHRIAMLTTPDQ